MTGNSGNIVIVGGYGEVGRMISARLSKLFPDRVVVAGRDARKASEVAREIGHGATGCILDVTVATTWGSLENIVLVVVCIDQASVGFVTHCFLHGVHYVDITAHDDFLMRVAAMEDEAAGNGAIGMLSVGVAPGLTNLLADHAVRRMQRVEQLDMLLEIGLGDHHGRAALEWMFDNLCNDFKVFANGNLVTVSSFGERIQMRLPGEKRSRSAYRFNFPDQRIVSRTLNVDTVSTWFRFSDRISTWLLAKAANAGVGHLLRRQPWRKFALWMFDNVSVGRDTCAVSVRATGMDQGKLSSITCALIGHGEALMTAIVASETVRQLLGSVPAAGVYHSHQIMELGPVIEALKAEIPDLLVQM